MNHAMDSVIKSGVEVPVTKTTNSPAGNLGQGSQGSSVPQHAAAPPSEPFRSSIRTHTRQEM